MPCLPSGGVPVCHPWPREEDDDGEVDLSQGSQQREIMKAGSFSSQDGYDQFASF